jgi:superoxide dismutase
MPGDPALKPKEITIDDFFHKVVMVRDRLRVLEQKVNSNKNLAEAEKVELQQYVTRCYGSLTTFNALFKEKSDFFSGSGVAKSENGTPAAVVRRRRD